MNYDGNIVFFPNLFNKEKKSINFKDFFVAVFNVNPPLNKTQTKNKKN